MTLTHFCKSICTRPLPYDVIKRWQLDLREEFEPLRSYFKPMDRLARYYPGKNEYISYRIVIHRDGTIVGIDDDDDDFDTNRIDLNRSDIVLYEFDFELFRHSLCDALGLHRSGIPLAESERTIPVGTWEPEKSARFPVYLLTPGLLQLRKQVLERIIEKNDFGEILLLPPRNRWDDFIQRAAQKNNVVLVPLDEAIRLENGVIRATPQWPEYLTAFCRMVDVALPSRYRKVVRDYVFARRDDKWFLQYGEITSKLDLELLGPQFIQYLLKYPDRRIPVRELWGEVMGTGRRRKKMETDFAETSSAFFDGDAVLDKEAKANYRNRLLELSKCRIRAEEENDIGELDRINTELETIESILKSSQGLGGKTVKIGNETKKLVDRIRRVLNTTFKKIGKENPNMARFLKNSIEFGSQIKYNSSKEVSWSFE